MDLVERAGASPEEGVAWSAATEDLNVNLMVLRGSSSSPSHVNSEVDVLLVGVSGLGRVRVEREEVTVAGGVCLVIPKGTRRGVTSGPEGFAFLLAHRRRAGLWPEAPLPHTPG